MKTPDCMHVNSMENFQKFTTRALLNKQTFWSNSSQNRDISRTVTSSFCLNDYRKITAIAVIFR